MGLIKDPNLLNQTITKPNQILSKSKNPFEGLENLKDQKEFSDFLINVGGENKNFVQTLPNTLQPDKKTVNIEFKKENNEGITLLEKVDKEKKNPERVLNQPGKVIEQQVKEQIVKEQSGKGVIPIEKPLEKITKKDDAVNKLDSNELFVFQREIENKPIGKNDSLSSFTKVFNVEKKDKKTEVEKPTQNIGNIANNDKSLEGIIKQNQGSGENLKFNSPKELFNWISKIISKNHIKAGETLNLQVRDNNLGQFNIAAQNGSSGGVNMAIISQTKESDAFFKANEKDLVKSLEDAGVKIGKLQILTAQNAASPDDGGMDMSDNQGSFSDSINNHFAQKDQLERDGKRRREIWNRFRDIRES
ncbi:MAG: hypothetical protein ACHQYQ_07225 [Bacteriovoracales bacterium]